MFILIRTLTYATLFVGFLLWAVPAQILAAAGLRAPQSVGWAETLGILAGLAGLGLTAGCLLTFMTVEKGTPAPFDPPRRLVNRGPYRLLRNPMYLGAAFWILGLAMFYHSLGIAVYAGVFLFTTHLFVVLYEEPTLRRMFGDEYLDYCRRVRRWWPS